MLLPHSTLARHESSDTAGRIVKIRRGSKKPRSLISAFSLILQPAGVHYAARDRPPQLDSCIELTLSILYPYFAKKPSFFIFNFFQQKRGAWMCAPMD
ncbi:hypothetical protein CL629_03785 [bacterium]|nr:hypothetical protein [bacterium]